MKSVGIDIGSSSIKVVEITSTNRGIQVSKYYEHLLGQNPAFDPELDIFEFVRQLTATYDPEKTKFILSIRQDRISTRLKTFPFTERLKILKSLPFELEEDLPFNSDNSVFDYRAVRYLGNQAEVLCCATPKTQVEQILTRFKDAGFEISIISSEAAAIANCFERWDDPVLQLPGVDLLEDATNRPERKIELVASIGHSRTILLAFENNRLISVRSILWGGKLIAEAIAKRYEIPYIDALKEMQNKAFILASKEGASYDQVVFSDVIGMQLKDLARDIKISILELKSELNGVVESVRLIGGVSHIINVHAFFTQQLEVPVNRTTILNQFPNVLFEKNSKIDAVCSVALGLAVEGIKKPRSPAINFLKGEFAQTSNQFKKFWEDWGSTIQVCLAAFVIFFIFSYLREDMALQLSGRTEDTLKVQAKSVAKLSKKQASETGVKKYLKEQLVRVREMKSISNLTAMNSSMEILKKVSDAFPQKNSMKVDVMKFSVNEQRVQIEGSLQTQAQIGLLQSALKGLSIDGQIEKISPSLYPKNGQVAFGFAFKVDRNIKR